MAYRSFSPSTNIPKQLLLKELSTLLKVSNALTASLDLSVVLQTAIDSTVDVLNFESGAIYILENDYLYLGAATPPLMPELHWLRLHPEALTRHPHLHLALQSGQPVFIHDAFREPLSPAEIEIRDARHLKSILYIPLLLEEKPIGALIVGTSSSIRQVRPHEVDLCCTLSSQISLAVANAQLFKAVQQSNNDLVRTYDATLQGWSSALEMRDEDTLGHTQRVTQLTEEVAHRLGVPEQDLPHVRRGALLHDIGKMAISDQILRKPGPLNEDEWAVMRKHPEYAYQFLVGIEYLLPALEIPFCHHEKWDGSGYPRGLRGQDIPLSARIFAVVDVYDALTSDRPYRKAWPVEKALCYIRRQVGRHFDPAIVAVFLEMMSEKRGNPLRQAKFPPA